VGRLVSRVHELDPRLNLSGWPQAGLFEEMNEMNAVNILTVVGLLTLLVGGLLVVALTMRRAMLGALTLHRAEAEDK
jgi:hypothetical protein